MSQDRVGLVDVHGGGLGVSNLEVDWFGTAAGGVPPFDGLYSCCYDTGRRKNNGVLRVQNHRVWLYGPDGCEEERHEH